MTKAVVLTVGLAADALEVVAMYNSLETLTLGSTDDVDERNLVVEDVLYGNHVAELELSAEVRREFDEFLLRSSSCLCKMALEGRTGLLFFLFVIGKLYSGVTVLFNCTDLRDNAGTSLDNGAWHVLTISTENGSHSDFLSN